jgi:hypothetical protein
LPYLAFKSRKNTSKQNLSESYQQKKLKIKN